MIPKIMPLEIPANWYITHNNYFTDTEPIIGEDGYATDKLSFKPDLMVIEQVVDKTSGNILDAKGDFLIDLGWGPEGDINGHYYLTLLYKNWNQVKLEYSSKDRYTIQYVINFCLNYIDKYQNVPNDFVKIVNEAIKSTDKLHLPKLMNLKFLEGIVVLHNNFYDSPLVQPEGASGDLLLKLKNTNGKTNDFLSWQNNSYSIILTADKTQPSYILQVLHDNQSDILFEYQSENRFLIQAIINLCIETITYSVMNDKFKAKVKQLINAFTVID